MRELILQALKEALVELDKHPFPTSMTKQFCKGISDVNPRELPQFMEREGIPDNAWFCVDKDDKVVLRFELEVPTTEEFVTGSKRVKFRTIAWKTIYYLLLHNGYKRVGFHSHKLQDFKGISVYDQCVKGDFDRVIDFYSLHFGEAE